MLNLFFSVIFQVYCQPERNYSDVTSPLGTKVFEANWDSLGQYEFPDWYRDAKLGIFIHWLVASVPAYDTEWYPRNMYTRGSDVFNHHINTYGTQDVFGMKDFIPLFTAEKFDSDEWAEIFKAAGAKYIVPVAEHHDGFAMYDSDFNTWNAVRMGPKRDVLGQLKKSFEKAGLVFGLSHHRLENAWFYNHGLEFTSDVQNRSIELYGFRAAYKTYTPEIALDWVKHTYELVDKYQPRIVYFDSSVNLITDSVNTYLAYYYNNALDWTGKTDVVVNIKYGFPETITVHDIERGMSKTMLPYPWQTDTSIGKKSWGYIENEDNKTPNQIVHELVDVVSKNGNLLLNIGPKPDGTITSEQQDVLAALGRWLAVNGEAIYSTRPWTIFGEGSTQGSSGAFSDNDDINYTVADMRFTTHGNDVYAVVLAWGAEVLITSLTPDKVGDAQLLDVAVLGSTKKVVYTQTAEGLKVVMPSKKPCEYAYAIKISFDRAIRPDFTVVELIDGTTEFYPAYGIVASSDQIRPQACVDEENPNVKEALTYTKIGEWAEYRINVQKEGIYRIYPRISSAYAAGAFDLSVDDTVVAHYTLDGTTGSWDTFKTVKDQSIETPLFLGTHTLKIAITESAVNIDIIYLDFIQ